MLEMQFGIIDAIFSAVADQLAYLLPLLPLSLWRIQQVNTLWAVHLEAKDLHVAYFLIWHLFNMDQGMYPRSSGSNYIQV